MILTTLCLALLSGADFILPQVAVVFQSQKDRKIELDWTIQTPGGLVPERTTRGTLWLSGERFRFEAPGIQAGSDASVAWQYAEATGQVLVQNASKLDASSQPAALLRAALLGKEISATQVRLAKDDAWDLVLDPAASSALKRFQSVHLWVRRKDMAPLQLEAKDAQGGRNLWVIRKLGKFSPKPSDFAISRPKGAEVVDLRN